MKRMFPLFVVTLLGGCLSRAPQAPVPPVERIEGGVLVLTNATSRCEIALVGARILSFSVRGHAVRWRPAKWKVTTAAEWTHGGIPVCWPWFGRSGPSAESGMHGFAYHTPFAVRSRTADSVTLCLVGKKGEGAFPEYAYDLAYTVALKGETLSLALVTRNTGDTAFRVSDGFHPYFRVNDRLRSYVKGLENAPWCNSMETMTFDGAFPCGLPLTRPLDHVFTVPDADCRLVDNSDGSQVRIRAKGNRKMVVWTSPRTPDGSVVAAGGIGGSEWRHFACVEPATLWRDQARLLAPGESHALEATVSLELANGKGSCVTNPQ